jgi:hypothetical protein
MQVRFWVAMDNGRLAKASGNAGDGWIARSSPPEPAVSSPNYNAPFFACIAATGSVYTILNIASLWL